MPVSRQTVAELRRKLIGLVVQLNELDNAIVENEALAERGLHFGSAMYAVSQIDYTSAAVRELRAQLKQQASWERMKRLEQLLH